MIIAKFGNLPLRRRREPVEPRVPDGPARTEPRGEAHPFFAYITDGYYFYHVEALPRIRALRTFDRARCEAALALEDLQKTVRAALEARLRWLAKEEKWKRQML